MSDSYSTSRLSTQLQNRYRLHLDSWMLAWCDFAVTRQTGHQQFHVPVQLTDLLVDAPEAIWPILMPCDLLPVVGNNAGDYLCLRVGEHNQVSEIVYWYHGGGDWIPWGKTLPDAIVFDAVLGCLPVLTKDHAIAAEDPRPETKDFVDNRDDPLLQWALDFVAPEVVAAVAEMFSANPDCDTEEPMEDCLDVLMQHGIAREAITLRRIQMASMNHEGIPNWQQIYSFADQVCGDRKDLAWAMNVAADAAVQLGWPDRATDCYRAALACSNFTDQSVRLGMEWDLSRSAKYAGDRLLVNGLFDPGDELQTIFCENETVAGPMNHRIRDHWLGKSCNYERQGDFGSALRCAISAGWDVGLTSMEAYRPILTRVIDLAESAQQFARAEIARVHLTCFEQRYG